MFHKNKMGSIARSTGTVFYSLLYSNSRRGLTPVAGLIFESKNRKIERFFWRDFSGEIFLEQHYCPYSFVPIN